MFSNIVSSKSANPLFTMEIDRLYQIYDVLSDAKEKIGEVSAQSSNETPCIVVVLN